MGNAKNINEIFGRNPVVMSQPDPSWPLASELVGIEIETEDLKGDPDLARPEWTIHKDDSLRNGTEFVLATPLGGKQLTAAITKFFNSGFKYNMSERTSVHVHVNASDNMTVDQFRNMFIIMYLIEPAIFRWADENRKWCGYCSPLTDLEPERIAGILAEQNDNNKALYKAVGGGPTSGRVDPDRYYGFNIKAFARHGTVEFRYFPCTKAEQNVVDWVKFAMCVKRAAMKAPEPDDFLRSISTRALLENFIDASFPEADLNQIIRDRLDFDDATGRVHELLNILLLTVKAITLGSRYAERSQGFAKLLNRKFPSVAKAAESIGEEAPKDSAAAALKGYLDPESGSRSPFSWAGVAGNAVGQTVPSAVSRDYETMKKFYDVYRFSSGDSAARMALSYAKKLRDLESRYPALTLPAAPGPNRAARRAANR